MKQNFLSFGSMWFAVLAPTGCGRQPAVMEAGQAPETNVTYSAKSGKVTLAFEKKGDLLVSKTKLPEGDGYNVVAQFKQTAEAKPLNLRFTLDMSLCVGCKRAEYGCTCGH